MGNYCCVWWPYYSDSILRKKQTNKHIYKIILQTNRFLSLICYIESLPSISLSLSLQLKNVQKGIFLVTSALLLGIYINLNLKKIKYGSMEANHFTPYDKEYMKMAMLKHEETFREQVLFSNFVCSFKDK